LKAKLPSNDFLPDCSGVPQTNDLPDITQLLGAFAKLRKATISYVMSVLPPA